MRILVFQHIECEHPVMFRNYFAELGVEWDVVELDQGQPIPNLNPYDALWGYGIAYGLLGCGGTSLADPGERGNSIMG